MIFSRVELTRHLVLPGLADRGTQTLTDCDAAPTSYGLDVLTADGVLTIPWPQVAFTVRAHDPKLKKAGK